MAEIKGLNKNATRMLTGLIMGTIAMGCIIQGKLALVGLLLFILYFATKEYVKILNNKGFYPSVKMIYIAETLLAIIAYFQRFDFVAAALTFSAIATFMWILFKGRQP
ncbi:phosphatidate cytidylyltransferase, partial [bacterium]|nr:phosphatidate cytidylyltransferase [bacterium]